MDLNRHPFRGLKPLMGKNLIIVFIFCLPPLLKGQAIFIDRFTTEDGLKDLRVTELLQDDHGFLWIATLDGLFRYDGRSFDEISFADENTGKSVYDLYYDNNQVLWIAGKKGISAYNGTDFRFYGLDNTIPGNFCHHLIGMNDKSIGFFYDQSFYRIVENAIHIDKDIPVDIVREIQDTYQSESGTTWILTASGNIYSKINDNFTGPYEVSLLADRFYKIKGSGSDFLAISTNRGIIEIPVKGQEIVKIDWMITKGGIQGFYVGSAHDIWLLNDNKLLKISDGDTLDTGINIQQPEKSVLMADNENNIWVSAWGKALYSIPGTELTRLPGEVTEGYPPTFFFNDEGQLWISYFGAGVKVYARDKSVNAIKSPPGKYVRAIEKTDKVYWFATAEGLIKKEENNLEVYTQENGLPHNYCYYLLADSLGKIWVSTEGGVGIIEGKNISAITTRNGLSDNRINYMTEWGTDKMILLSERNIDLYEEGQIKSLIEHPFRSKETLNTICRDRFGNFWIGSDMHGLIFYHLGKAELVYLSGRLGLDFLRVRTIEAFGRDQLCLGTEKGLIIIKIDKEGNILNVRSLGPDRGYPDFEINQNAVQRMGDKIYFGTNIGTIIFNPSRLTGQSGGPEVNITGIDVSFRETDWGNKRFRLDPWFQVPLNPVMEHNKNDLKLKFNSISLRSNKSIWYRYKLDHHDRSWSSPTKENSVIYANLRPGKYLFIVQASYDGINWGSNSKSYAFVIAPPFWNTWWFIVILIAFLLLGFVFFNNYRIKLKVNQLMALERLRKEEYGRLQKKVAMDFHDEVGNHLASISLLINLIKSEDWKIPAKLTGLLEKINIESNNLFNGTRDFIWSIDPENNNLKAMYNYIKDYGIELFENSAIYFHTQNGQDIDNIDLPPGFTRQIVLIFKEGINNALLHAGCKNVYFKILLNKNDFAIQLIDDGKGFNADELDYYEGIKKMKYRGAKIKSELKVRSNENQGTEITLIANYK